MRYPVLLVLTLAACFAAQAVALRAVGGRTTKSESNYFSSLGRIQAGARGEPEIMLLGSSITGRLPDRANGFKGFANMGCDGGSAVDVLRAMDRGILPTAPVLVVETNTLRLALLPTESEVGSALDKPWFRAGLRVPALSAYARPSAFLYSRLLARRVGDFGEPETGPDLEISSRPVHLTEPPAAIVADEMPLVEELVPLINRLRERGCRVVFAALPPGGGERGGSPAPWLQMIVAGTQSEWWDLGGAVDPGLIELTDGVHMSAPSAARTVRSLRLLRTHD